MSHEAASIDGMEGGKGECKSWLEGNVGTDKIYDIIAIKSGHTVCEIELQCWSNLSHIVLHDIEGRCANQITTLACDLYVLSKSSKSIEAFP